MAGTGRVRQLILAALTISAAILSCTAPFNLEDLLDGPDRQPLSVSPNGGTLVANQTITLTVSGGHPPYEFTVSGDGSMEGNAYRAPASSGSATIAVRDAVGRGVSAEFVIDASAISVGISPATQTVYTGGAVEFSSFGGSDPYTFTIADNQSGGSIDAASGLYTAGSSPGTDTVRVTDGVSTTADATVIVLEKPLSIAPVSASVHTSQSVQFGAVGGDGPFVFSVTGDSGASIDPSTGLYTAGPNAGTDTVTMLDAYDNRERFATVTVYLPDVVTNVDYAPGAITNITGTEKTGEPFTAETDIANVGSANGTKDVSWTVYASLDTTIGGADYVVASGTVLGGLDAGISQPVAINGTWPPVAADYYLLIAVRAADDLDPGNDVNQSAAALEITDRVSISPASASVYTGQEIAFSATGPQPYTFTIVTNQTGGSIDPGGGLYSAGSSPGTDTIRVTDAFLDTADATVTVSSPPLPTAVDYEILSVAVTGGGTTAGGAVSGEFEVANTGSAGGEHPLSWTVYASLDDTLSAGDKVVDSGTTSQLAAAGSAVVPFAGSWPGEPASYHLVASVSAVDDTNTANNTGSTATATTVTSPPAADVDYYVSAVPSGGNVGVDTAMDESFTISNAGSEAGSATVSWTAYISAGPNFDPADEVAGSGSFAGLAAGAGEVVNVTGTWPTSSGIRYLILRVQAADDVNGTNNTASSGSFVIEDPAVIDYVPADISSAYPVVTTGSPISETFSVTNIGGMDGAQTITWRAYASLDQVPEPGEQVGWGSLAPLAGGTTAVGITATGFWPAVPGDYYLIVEVDAADEANRNDYVVSAGTFRVNDPPDYRFHNVVFPAADYGGHPNELWSAASFLHGGPIVHSFEILETNNAPGRQSIQWHLYLSDDPTLDAGDPVVHQGLLPPLESGASSGPIELEDWPLPASPGRYYYILKLAAGDDANASNDTYLLGPVDVWQPDDPIENTSDLDRGSYYDFFIRPNRGEVIRIEGQINEMLEFDAYYITAGVDVTEFRMLLSWGSNADLDLYFYSVDPDLFLDRSFDAGGSREPQSGTFNVPVTPGQRYRVDVSTFDATPGQVGGTYTLEVTAYPLP